MKTQIKAVAFDLGGVLIDWNPRYLYRKLMADDAALERFLAEVCTPAWNARFDAGRPFAEGIAELVAAHPGQADLIEAYWVRWPEMLGQSFPETLAEMRRLKAAGIPIYALSNWSAETFAITRARFPFLEEFDGLLISGEVGVAKPNPEIFRLFLERFSLEPATTLFIDDSPANVEAAKAAGMQATLAGGH